MKDQSTPMKGKASVLSRRRLIKTAAAAGTAAVASPFILRLARADSLPIKIGLPVPLTGPYGTEARDQATCAQIAVDEFNAAGGLNGRMAQILVRDTKLNAGVAATRTLELVEKEKVNFVAGSLSAAIQLTINNITKAHKTIFVSISQSDAISKLPDWSPYTFHEALNPHMTAGAVGRYVFPKHKRAVYLGPDYAFGTELLAGYRYIGKKYGVKELDSILVPLGTSDFSSFFPRIVALKPDVLIVNNFGLDQLNTLKQATDFGLKHQMKIACSVLLFDERLNAGAEVYDGVIGGSNYYWELEKKYASAKRLNDAFRKKEHGRVPSDYGAYGYAGVYALLQGVRKAGSVDTDKVIKAMQGMKYDAYKGTEEIRACDHQAIQSVLILGSKPKSKVKGKYDVFDILHVDPASEKDLLSCAAEGHK